MDQLRQIRQLMRSLSDETRLRVLNLLAEFDELNVSQLCGALECNQSMMSKHLMQLRMLGLVEDRRDGNSVYYARIVLVDDSHQNLVLSVLKSIDAVDAFAEDVARCKGLSHR